MVPCSGPVPGLVLVCVVLELASILRTGTRMSDDVGHREGRWCIGDETVVRLLTMVVEWEWATNYASLVCEVGPVRVLTWWCLFGLVWLCGCRVLYCWLVFGILMNLWIRRLR